MSTSKLDQNHEQNLRSAFQTITNRAIACVESGVLGAAEHYHDCAMILADALGRCGVDVFTKPPVKEVSLAELFNAEGKEVAA